MRAHGRLIKQSRCSIDSTEAAVAAAAAVKSPQIVLTAHHCRRFVSMTWSWCDNIADLVRRELLYKTTTDDCARH